jgi:hypothetical protein
MTDGVGEVTDRVGSGFTAGDHKAGHADED